MQLEDMPRPVGYVLAGGGSLGAIQVGMLQALSELGVVPDFVAGTSVGSRNGAVVASDPKGAANRLSHIWARVRSQDVFPGNLLAQVHTLRRSKTHLFPNSGLSAIITPPSSEKPRPQGKDELRKPMLRKKLRRRTPHRRRVVATNGQTSRVEEASRPTGARPTGLRNWTPPIRTEWPTS